MEVGSRSGEIRRRRKKNQQRDTAVALVSRLRFYSFDYCDFARKHAVVGKDLQMPTDALKCTYSSEKTAVLSVYVCALLDQEVAGSNPVAPTFRNSRLVTRRRSAVRRFLQE